MEVLYDDKKLENLCTDEKEMKKRRSDIAAKLRLRVKALYEADSVGDLKELDQLGYWHQLKEDLAGQWGGSVSRNERLVIRPEGDCEQWDATTVTVTNIGDYH